MCTNSRWTAQWSVICREIDRSTAPACAYRQAKLDQSRYRGRAVLLCDDLDWLTGPIETRSQKR
ncbi:MAG: hypothetical protein CMJ75_03520 [Planctomycetaceae bacterium]|nr:hypothetical protein [Planctomycetaceae bacterium]